MKTNFINRSVCNIVYWMISQCWKNFLPIKGKFSQWFSNLKCYKKKPETFHNRCSDFKKVIHMLIRTDTFKSDKSFLFNCSKNKLEVTEYQFKGNLKCVKQSDIIIDKCNNWKNIQCWHIKKQKVKSKNTARLMYNVDNMTFTMSL